MAASQTNKIVQFCQCETAYNFVIGIDDSYNIVLYLCTICFILFKGLFPGALSAEILKFHSETVFGNSPFTDR